MDWSRFARSAIAAINPFGPVGLQTALVFLVPIAVSWALSDVDMASLAAFFAMYIAFLAWAYYRQPWDRVPRKISGRRQAQLAELLDAHLFADPEHRPVITICNNGDVSATQALRKMFRDAGWTVHAWDDFHEPDYRQGIWISGPHRARIRAILMRAGFTAAMLEDPYIGQDDVLILGE